MSYIDTMPPMATGTAYYSELEGQALIDYRRAQHRQRSIDMFLEWCNTRLPEIGYRDESEAYEAYHERRLALGLAEEQVLVEQANYDARQANTIPF